MNSHVLLLAILLILPRLVGAQMNQETSHKIDALFAKYNENTPGVVVGVLEKGKFVFSKGYGSANLEYKIPNSSKTIFHLASVSKQFTAFAIYLLESRGRLSLEDNIRTYLPELPEYEEEIKIKHLLSHTSGLREQFLLLTLAGWDMEDRITTEHVLDLAFAQKNLNFEPGTQFGYCNTGYTFLALIVERITGMKFKDFCATNIFTPLGMSNTQFYEDSKQIVANRAYSYEMRDRIYVHKKLNYSIVGATSLFSTVEDLAKWANNFDKLIVGDKKLMKSFNQISKLNNGDPLIWKMIGNDTLYHAKGQFIRDYKGVKVFKHGGHDAGYRTFLARFPKEDLTIITLSNDEHYEIFARGMEIAEFILSDQLQENTPSPSPSKKAKGKVEKYTAINLEQYAGKYFSDELNTHYHL
ncbi:MAG: serine hydrolase domain-containing protein, partial [Bacteroidota bacterium]